MAISVDKSGLTIQIGCASHQDALSMVNSLLSVLSSQDKDLFSADDVHNVCWLIKEMLPCDDQMHLLDRIASGWVEVKPVPPKQQ